MIWSAGRCCGHARPAGRGRVSLYLFLHHIIFDGFSIIEFFLPELVTIYNALLAGSLLRFRNCVCNIPTSPTGSGNRWQRAAQ